MSIIAGIAEKLRRKFSKIVQETQGIFTLLILYKGKEPKIVLCISNSHKPYIYGKISSMDEVSSLDCERLLFEPHGLYIFAKTIDEFAEKALVKSERMLSLE